MAETATARRRSSRRKAREPVDVRLTVAVNFGDTPEEQVVVIDDRRLLMVDSVFRYRDRIARFTTLTLVRAAMLQPKVASRLLPGLALLAGRNRN